MRQIRAQPVQRFYAALHGHGLAQQDGACGFGQAFEAAGAELQHEFALPTHDRNGQGLSSSLQRGWESIKAMLGQPTMPSLMNASEDAERMLLTAYRTALRESLPEATRMVLQRQAMAVQRGIEALHWLRSCLPL